MYGAADTSAEKCMIACDCLCFAAGFGFPLVPKRLEVEKPAESVWACLLFSEVGSIAEWAPLPTANAVVLVG